MIAKFQATNRSANTKSLLFYGHYDVQPVVKKNWVTPPFALTGSNGYLYGRGASDNKGPIIATILAAADLYRKRQLNCDVSFVIEGEEESGSHGFYDAVEKCRDFFGKVDVLLISNSYWIDDATPCITYGLRGVIHASIEIASRVDADLHSGMMGGAIYEPLQDMVKVLAQLMSDDRRVSIPGFNDQVRPATPEEEAIYEELAAYIKAHIQPGEDTTKAQLLMAKWRFPTLTVHKVEVIGPASNTIIPRAVRADVSMRIVPDQDLNDIIMKFQRYVKQVFVNLQSTNDLKITIGHRANWWLGKVKSPYFKLAEQAIEEQWKMKPLHIREGGSIPAIPWLESFFCADAVHIPMGQSTDNAHLPNERIRLENLVSGQKVIETFLTKIGQMQ